MKPTPNPTVCQPARSVRAAFVAVMVPALMIPLLLCKKPEYLTLTESRVVQGIRFHDGTMLKFSKSGRIEIAALSRDTTIGAITFKSSTTVNFYDSGIPSHGYVSGGKGPYAVPMKNGGLIMFYESGKIRSFEISGPYLINGIQLDDGASILLDSIGKLTGFSGCGTTIENLDIQGIPVSSGSSVCFFENGRLKSMSIPENRKLQGIHFQAGTVIELYQSGKIMEGVIAQPLSAGEATINAGSRVLFDEKGNAVEK